MTEWEKSQNGQPHVFDDEMMEKHMTAIVLAALILPLSSFLPQMFLKASEIEAIRIAQEYLRTIAIFYWICGIQYILLNLFRGMGQMRVSTFSACIDPIMRLASAWLLGNLWGRRALWFAWPISWVFALIIPAICFLRGNWQEKLPTANHANNSVENRMS